MKSNKKITVNRLAFIMAAVAVVTFIPVGAAHANAVLVSNCVSTNFAHQTISLASAGAVHRQQKDIYYSTKTIASAGTSWFQPTYTYLRGYGTDLSLVARSHGGFWYSCEV